MDENTLKQLDNYVTELFGQEDDILRHIQAVADKNNMPDISLLPFEGRLLQFLAEMIGAKKILEIGTLAGYSGVYLARALPDDGQLITIEAYEKHAKVAQANFEYAGLSDKVEVRLGNALETLETLGSEAPFDMVFMDADKEEYLQYLDWAIEHVRVGGIILAHNALRHGKVLNPDNAWDFALVEYNKRIASDERLSSYAFNIGDGLAVSIKKT